MRIYKPLISKKLYGDPFKNQIIQSFNNCYDFVIQLCDQYPDCKGNYNELDTISRHIMEGIDRHYATETIHRAYRHAVANGEILEPITAEIRKEKTEQTMHDINQWTPNNFISFTGTQTKIYGEGYEK